MHTAAERVGLRQHAVVARGDVAATIEAVLAAHAKVPKAAVGMTGGSELVRAVRAALRTHGISDVKMKTHWIAGSRGLD